jgi:hypothetical protein
MKLVLRALFAGLAVYIFGDGLALLPSQPGHARLSFLFAGLFVMLWTATAIEAKP